jgi:hypothetical protein
MGHGWEALRNEPQARRYLGSPEMLRAPRVADIVLADAAATAAGMEGLVDQVLLEEASLAPLDLLSPRHRAATFREAVGQGLGPPPGFMRATAAVSRFVIIRAHDEVLTGRLTLRAAGDVTVVANGVHVITFTAEPSWGTYDVPMPLCRGRNLISLHWPHPRPDVAATFERAARRLERGLYPEVLAAFGEIHAFTAS